MFYIECFVINLLYIHNLIQWLTNYNLSTKIFSVINLKLESFSRFSALVVIVRPSVV